MSYVDCDSYDQNVSPYLRRRLRTYDEALSERQAARPSSGKAAAEVAPQHRETGPDKLLALIEAVGVTPGPASRPAPHDAQTAVDAITESAVAAPVNATSVCAVSRLPPEAREQR